VESRFGIDFLVIFFSIVIVSVIIVSLDAPPPLSSCHHLVYPRANACLIAPLSHSGWLSLSSCHRRHHRRYHHDHHRFRLVVATIVIVTVVAAATTTIVFTVVVIVVAVVAAIVVAVVVVGIVVIIHHHRRHYHHRHLCLVVFIVAVVSVIVISVSSAPPLFPLSFPLCLLQSAMMTMTLLLLSLSYRDDDLRRMSFISIFVVNIIIALDPIQDPQAAKEMIAASDVTIRAVVIILFGTVVAVWAAVGMPLLYGKILVLARVMFCLVGTFFTCSYRSCGCETLFFLTMTIVQTAPPKNTEFPPKS
jgi:hypothetical protein